MRLIKEFRVIDLPLGVGGAIHSLYIKQHHNKSESRSDAKTIFVGNIDYCGQLSHGKIDRFLRDFFSGFGDIESISISEFSADDDNRFHKISRFAHIKFEKKSSLSSAINASDEIYAAIAKEVSHQFGYGNLCYKKSGKDIVNANLMYDTDVSQIKKYADEYMLEFDKKEEIEMSFKRKRMKEEDEDGFILVDSKKKKRKRMATNSHSTGEGRVRKKKKSYELKNFYRFQMKEVKREQLHELRQKFQQDKLKVAKMKEGRKFKPF
eukprot:CAMPEP_0182433000 /NCGR_PEP_ID=MMETSP1167-20130531/60172_1 /TAXON_ID=2988 /ORGANISM="Mallomonas Sp, Strain CCMP3275" /LENGTH=264 /DNA_ID=CAMNT_0024621137 /DNA_START=33 /DNA_END=827 /DNA_ORIENTATION=-